MSGVIDLTSESPPQPPRNIAGGSSSNSNNIARAGPSTSTSSTSRQRRPLQHDPDGSIEFVGMNSTARGAAGTSVHNTGSSTRHDDARRNFRGALAHDVLLARAALEGGPRAPALGVRIRDDLPPGPHRQHPNPNAAAAGRAGLFGMLGGAHRMGFGVAGPPLNVAAGVLSRMLGGGVLGLGGGGGNAARAAPTGPRGGRRPAAQNEVPIPEKFDPALTLQDGEPGKGFSFGIVEPPVEVEHFEEDPHAITGPLPDTTAVCARCEFALVQGGSGDKRVWALCCGHVLDGRCVEELCGRREATRKREAQLEEWRAAVGEATTTLTAEKEKEKETRNNPPTPKGKGKGKARLVSDLEDGGFEVNSASQPSKASRTSVSQASATSRRRVQPSTPSKLTRSAAAAVEASAPPPRPSTPPFKPRAFRCPVEHCGIKSRVEPNHPNSAIELFL